MKTNTIQSKLKLLLLTLLCASAVNFSIHAQETYWNNDAGTGDWNDEGNWDGGVPNSGVEAYVFGHTAVIHAGSAGSAYQLYLGQVHSNSDLLVSGTLNVNAGSYLGSTMSSYSSATVNSNGYWNTVSLLVGKEGNGILTITDSGKVYSTSSIISQVGAGGLSRVTVSGSGFWSSDTLSIANSVRARGSLTLTDNARLESIYSNIGDAAFDSAGSVTVSDSAYWHNSGTINVGNSGTGTLYLNGGTVQTDKLVLGNNLGSHGTLEIGGSGSGKIQGLQSNGTADIYGGSGSGAVQFVHSGTIDFANAINGTNVSVEHNSPGSTTLTANSAIKNLSVSGGILNIDGDVTLTLQNGGAATVSNGGWLGGAGILTGGSLTVESGGVLSTTLTLANGLTLEAGAILGCAGNTSGLQITGGTLTLGESILVDFSSLTATGDYIVLDWSNASVTGDITDAQFNIAGTGVEGTFTVNAENKQLTFNATAVPEPATYFLMGAGLGVLLLTARHRRHNVQS
jgi:T5SS/PEP-CTERM-associated repeat protein